jgi:hypothetical protein
MRKLTKIGAAAAGLVLAGGAAAAAVTAPPEAADTGLTTAEENSGLELPASQGHPAPGDHPTGEDHPTGDDHPGGTNDAEAVDAAAEAHGAEVSAVARDDSTTGREHGESVSEVARAGHGGPAEAGADAAVETPNTGGTGTADEASDGASEVGTDQAADQAAAGSGNAGDHARP